LSSVLLEDLMEPALDLYGTEVLTQVALADPDLQMQVHLRALIVVRGRGARIADVPEGLALPHAVPDLKILDNPTEMAVSAHQATAVVDPYLTTAEDVQDFLRGARNLGSMSQHGFHLVQVRGVVVCIGSDHLSLGHAQHRGGDGDRLTSG
jgi:hypothetical protein